MTDHDEHDEPRQRTQGSTRISKDEWYRRGGFANSRCWRRQPTNSDWQYFYRHD